MHRVVDPRLLEEAYVARAAYHGAANAWTCGIGITQGSRAEPRSAPDSTVTTDAVDAAAS